MANKEHNMNKLEAQCRVIISEAYMNLPEHVDVPDKLEVEFFTQSRTAGRAIGTCRIQINSDLAEQYPDQLRDTVLHELAHCLTVLRHQRRVKPHGAEWQEMAVMVGANPKACHDMEQPDLPVQRHSTHLFRCGCRDHHLKAGRYNKFLCHGVIYTCRSCKQPLELVL